MTNDHMTDWLGAYLDGELRVAERKRIEAHLAQCSACRTELETLQQISRWLQSDPLPEPLIPTARFATQVALQLPPRVTRHSAEIGWGLTLLGVLLALGVVQIASGLGTLLSLGIQYRFLQAIANGLSIGLPNNVWLSILTFIVQNSVERNSALLQLLYQINAWLSPLASSLVWQGRIAALYWVGLFLWWLHWTREASPRSTPFA